MKGSIWTKATFLILFLNWTKFVHSSGKLKLVLSHYQERKGDGTTKCIKLCVGSSPTGLPRNLNTTTGHSTVNITRLSKSYPNPSLYYYNFSEWRNNTILSVTVWKLSSKLTCDLSSPTNTTIHGTAQEIIPRQTTQNDLLLTDINGQWKIRVQTHISCTTPNCLHPCIPHDNSTGHYTCQSDNTKQCPPNWYGPNCLKSCIPRNDSSALYYCSSSGEKVCGVDWYGINCTIFCSKNAQNYKCTSEGKRICLPHWFGETFCNKTASNYICMEDGRRVCLSNWYTEYCTTFCNNSKSSYKCNNNGEKICLHNWYGDSCSRFCNNSAMSYKCDSSGKQMDLAVWYKKHNSKFGENTAACNSTTSPPVLIISFVGLGLFLVFITINIMIFVVARKKRRNHVSSEHTEDADTLSISTAGNSNKEMEVTNVDKMLKSSTDDNIGLTKASI